MVCIGDKCAEDIVGSVTVLRCPGSVADELHDRSRVGFDHLSDFAAELFFDANTVKS